MTFSHRTIPLLIVLALALANTPSRADDPARGKPFAIAVVDEQTGRGVPLVELTTVNGIRLFTDSNGIVAFDEPGLMNQSVFFFVRSHGYEYPKEGFGYRGKAIAVKPGGSARLDIKRLNIAERLYRVTGEGIYRDSVLVDHPVPIRHPLLNARVLGSDSVVNALYKGKLFWFWGDTNRPGHPLGNYQVTGATSILPGQGGLDPEVGVDLDYFIGDKGFAKAIAPVPGKGPTWIGGLVVLKDAQGRERLFADYAKIRGMLDVYERGVVEFNDETSRFEKVATFALEAPLHLDGHPFLLAEGGTEYVRFGAAIPLIRVKADPESIKDPTKYEAFTCLKEGSGLKPPRVDRNDDGTVRYGWKRNTPSVGPAEQATLIKAGLLKREEALIALMEADTGKAFAAHNGSVCWNDFRRRWVLLATESGGSSPLGEIWYAEADTPLGPWVYARKVLTHDRYTFYNPKQHPYFAKEGGRIIFFEGTYTHTFSGNPDVTPRYDYNQVMYRLDLSDPRLNLPVPIYRASDDPADLRPGASERAEGKDRPIAFFALDRAAPGTVPVSERIDAGGQRSLHLGATPDAAPIFHALPADMKDAPATAVPLYEFVDRARSRRAYGTDREWSSPGFERSERPVCLVWRSPFR